jgi:serine phosphatase RsbU (regulator of sigma subunit)
MKPPFLKNQLLFHFTILLALAMLGISGLFYLNEKRSLAETIFQELDETHILSMQAFKLQSDYLFIESKNEAYYQSGKSEIINNFNYNLVNLQNRLQKLNLNTRRIDPTLQTYNYILTGLHNYYGLMFKRIQDLYFKRGFKDRGLEGRMREFAHLLMNEKVNSGFDYKILLLRRHEKDFIIRKELVYVKEYKKLLSELVLECRNWPPLLNNKHKMELGWLLNYGNAFDSIVKLESKIGLHPNQGYQALLNKSFNTIQGYYSEYGNSLTQIKNDYSTGVIITMIVYSTLTVIILFWVARHFILKLTNGVSLIRNTMSAYVETNFTSMPKVTRLPDNYEFRSILVSFLKISKEMNEYINFFKQKVDERTKEINKQKEEIESQKLMILKQNSLLSVQKLELEIGKENLQMKNKDLLDSIRYAKRLQDALLIPSSDFKNYLQESFVLFMPKDIVSGDFYWIDSINVPKKILIAENKNLNGAFENEPNNKHEKLIMIAAADCTGHGVPGAFMSILGIEAMRKCINEKNISSPGKLLYELNNEVLKSLHYQSNGKGVLRDGMDLSVVVFCAEKQRLIFSGANAQIIRVRNASAEVFKGNKRPIGSYDLYFEKIKFCETEIDVKAGDTFYLFSDGFTDQFGGVNDKKFKRRQFTNLLIDISKEEMDLQRELLRVAFNNWRGNKEQVDDVLVMGFRFDYEIQHQLLQ